MTPKVQVGTILIEKRPLIAQVLGLESEPYSGTWSVIKGSRWLFSRLKDPYCWVELLLHCHWK